MTGLWQQLPWPLLVSMAFLCVGVVTMLCLWLFETWLLFRRKVVGAGRHLVLVPAIIVALWAPLFGIGLYQLDVEQQTTAQRAASIAIQDTAPTWGTTLERARSLGYHWCASVSALVGLRCGRTHPPSLLRIIVREMRRH